MTATSETQLARLIICSDWGKLHIKQKFDRNLQKRNLRESNLRESNLRDQSVVQDWAFRTVSDLRPKSACALRFFLFHVSFA